MFEHEQAIVQALLEENEEFRRLYLKHQELKQQVQAANDGTVPLDDFALEELKKKKLRIKDQLARMLNAHRGAAA